MGKIEMRCGVGMEGRDVKEERSEWKDERGGNAARERSRRGWHQLGAIEPSELEEKWSEEVCGRRMAVWVIARSQRVLARRKGLPLGWV